MRPEDRFCTLRCWRKATAARNLADRLRLARKACTSCGVEKAISAFSLKSKTRLTYSPTCKICHNAVRREHYVNNKQAAYAQAKAGKVRRQEWYRQLKAKLSCNRCPERHPATLQFHHRDPTKKDFTLSWAMMRGFSVKRIEVEMAKCEVLCANCHFKEHYGKRGWASGKSTVFQTVG